MATDIATAEVFGKKPAKLLPPDVLANLRKAIPGYDQITKLLSGNILGGLQGQLAPGVANVVADAANARAVGGGFGGSGLGRNLELRDLGLTSKGVMDQAMAQAFNFIPMQSQVGTVNQGIQNDINQFNNLVDAAPNPVKRAQWEIDSANEAAAMAMQNQAQGVGGIRYNRGVGIGGGLGGARPIGPGQFQPAPVWSPAPIGNGNFSGTGNAETSAALAGYVPIGPQPAGVQSFSPANAASFQTQPTTRQFNGDSWFGDFTNSGGLNFGNQPAYDVNNILLNTAGINPADFGMA